MKYMLKSMKARVIKNITKYVKLTNEIPMEKDVLLSLGITEEEFTKYCGSWDNVLLEAGINKDLNTEHTFITRDQVKEEIKIFYETNKDFPTFGQICIPLKKYKFRVDLISVYGGLNLLNEEVKNEINNPTEK